MIKIEYKIFLNYDLKEYREEPEIILKRNSVYSDYFKIQVIAGYPDVKYLDMIFKSNFITEKQRLLLKEIDLGEYILSKYNIDERITKDVTSDGYLEFHLIDVNDKFLAKSERIKVVVTNSLIDSAGCDSDYPKTLSHTELTDTWKKDLHNIDSIIGLEDAMNVINTNNDNLLERLDQEIQDRIDSDIAINEKIDNLTTDLTTDINDLDVKLDKEIQDRIDGDLVLDNKINSLNTTLTADIGNLDNKLDKEIQDRIDGDLVLDNKINSLNTTLTADIGNLDNKLDKEIQDRIDGDANLRSLIDDNKVLIDNELQFLKDEDVNLNNKIDALDTKLTDDIATLNTTITNNINDLDIKLDKEIQDRINEDKKLDDKINDLDLDLNNKVTTLGNDLTNNINNLNTNLTNNINTLETDLNAIISNVDTNLTQLIEQEKQERISEDAKLDLKKLNVTDLGEKVAPLGQNNIIPKRHLPVEIFRSFDYFETLEDRDTSSPDDNDWCYVNEDKKFYVYIDKIWQPITLLEVVVNALNVKFDNTDSIFLSNNVQSVLIEIETYLQTSQNNDSNFNNNLNNLITKLNREILDRENEDKRIEDKLDNFKLDYDTKIPQINAEISETNVNLFELNKDYTQYKSDVSNDLTRLANTDEKLKSEIKKLDYEKVGIPQYFEIGEDLRRNANEIDELKFTKLDKSEYNSFVDNITGNLNDKLNITDFDTFKLDNENNLNDKLNITDFDTFKTDNENNLNDKLDVTDFDTFKLDNENNLNDKLNITDFDTFKTDNENNLNDKLDVTDFDTFKLDNENNFNSKVDITFLTSTLNSYVKEIKIKEDILTTNNSLIDLTDKIQTIVNETALSLSTSSDLQLVLDKLQEHIDAIEPHEVIKNKLETLNNLITDFKTELENKITDDIITHNNDVDAHKDLFEKFKDNITDSLTNLLNYIQSENTTIQGQINDLNTSLIDNTTSINSLTTQLNSLGGTVTGGITDFDIKISNHNNSETAHSFIQNKITQLQNKVDELNPKSILTSQTSIADFISNDTEAPKIQNGNIVVIKNTSGQIEIYKFFDTASIIETRGAVDWNKEENYIKLQQEINLDTASTTNLGIVGIGSNVQIDNQGFIYLDDASTTTKGLVQIGTLTELQNGSTTKVFTGKEIKDYLTAQLPQPANATEVLTGTNATKFVTPLTLPINSIDTTTGLTLTNKKIGFDKSKIEFAEELTYAQLKTLKDTNKLIAGKYYLMTDFLTSAPSGHNATGTVEPLLLFATDVNKFATRVYSPSFPKDIIEFNFDTGATGKIILRHDLINNNRTPYDFRNILWRRYRAVGPILEDGQSGTKDKAYIIGTEVYLCVNSGTFNTNNFVKLFDTDDYVLTISIYDLVLSSGTDYALRYTFDDNVDFKSKTPIVGTTQKENDLGTSLNTTNNIFLKNSSKNIFNGVNFNNTFTQYVSINTFGNISNDNIAIKAFANNSSGQFFNGNIFSGTNNYNNTFGDTFIRNIFKDSVIYNVFLGLHQENVFKGIANATYINNKQYKEGLSQTEVDTRINTLVPQATTTTAGKIRIATSTEATTGADNTVSITPLLLKNLRDAGFFATGSGGVKNVKSGSAIFSMRANYREPITTPLQITLPFSITSAKYDLIFDGAIGRADVSGMSGEFLVYPTGTVSGNTLTIYAPPSQYLFKLPNLQPFQYTVREYY